MDRRTFLLGTGAALAAGATGAPAVAAPPQRNLPVISWHTVGGFVPLGVAAVRPTVLAVYAGGYVVAECGQQLKLAHREVELVRAHAVRVLHNPANTRRNPDAPAVADVPETRFTVRSTHGTMTRQVMALGESRTELDYPAPLYQLADRLIALRTRVMTRGTPYRPAAVRLVVVADTQPDFGVTRAWPREVPVPALKRDLGLGQLHLYGAAARTVARTIPRPDAWSFSPYRLGDGRTVRVAWRYLLAHE